MIVTKAEREALQWLLDRWDAYLRPVTSDPERNEKVQAHDAIVALLTSDAQLRDRHEAAQAALPMTPEQLVETTQVARMVMAGQLAPSPFMTLSFAKALAETQP